MVKKKKGQCQTTEILPSLAGFNLNGGVRGKTSTLLAEGIAKVFWTTDI
jgi:hypothetical protein